MAKIKKEHFLIIISFLGIFFAVILSLLNHWEMGGETWGYWYFARVFSETGKFMIPDRSPLYILYLNLFYWIGYPNSVTIEYVVTTTIAVVALALFFKKYIGLGWATFAAILWIPFLQVSEPPVQKLALACSLFAVIARQTGENRFKYMLSYAFLFLAYMFRLSYLVLIPLFGLYDLIRLIGERKKIFWRPRLSSDWPIMVVMVLLVWFSVMQSPHPWNNSWLATNKWFPCDGKNLARASFIQSFSWTYIETKYKSYVNRDFYFTNKELCDGHSDFIGAIRHAPKIFAIQTLGNIRSLLYSSIGLTEFVHAYPRPPGLLYPYLLRLFYWICALILFSVIVYGAFCAATKDKLIILFMAGNLLLVVTNILSVVKQRYGIPLIPVFILSAYWYALQVNKKNRYFSKEIVLAVTLALFSSGITNWTALSSNLVDDFKENKIKVLETRPYSMKASFAKLNSIAEHKRGILSLEHAFMGAFLKVPLKNIYDIWEIPPFGRFGQLAYNGLKTSRIDCVFVSNELATGIGCGTNYQIRYQNYIKPYVNKLIANGAIRQVIPRYGNAYFIRSNFNEEGPR